jgi:hypothetical protein
MLAWVTRGRFMLGKSIVLSRPSLISVVTTLTGTPSSVAAETFELPFRTSRTEYLRISGPWSVQAS